MNNSGNSGSGGGIIGIIAVLVVGVGGLFAAHSFAPALFKILIWVVIGVVVLLIGLIVLIIVLANKSGKYKDEKTSVNGKLTDEQSGVITTSRQEVMELRRVIMQIHVMPIRLSANEACALLDKILKTLKEQPDEIKNARQCLNYYIPTLKNVMSHFRELESKGQMNDDMQKKTESFLSDVKSALQKQYDNLFDNEKLNMEVDMEAMTIAIKRDGLL